MLCKGLLIKLKERYLFNYEVLGVVRNMEILLVYIINCNGLIVVYLKNYKVCLKCLMGS